MSMTRPSVSRDEETASQSLAERAYQQIKEWILEMRYKPGDVLSETELTAELGMSRTPIREALRWLRHDGLLQWIPGKGSVVYGASLHDIEEIFDIKESLEGTVARLAARHRPKEAVVGLEAAVQAMRDAVEREDHEAWRQADAAFHQHLFAAAGNKRAEQIIRNLNEQWHRLRVGLMALDGRTRESTEEHMRILEAIKAGDEQAAEQAMREHLARLRRVLLTLVRNLILPYVGENL